jgi:hypothetical protein
VHRATKPPLLPALHGTPARNVTDVQAAGTAGLAALALIRGVHRADLVLIEVSRGLACPNALRDLVTDLASDPAALEGACRVIQKTLEPKPRK